MNNPEHPASFAVILLSTLLRVGVTVASFFFGSALLGAAWRRLMLGWGSGPTTIWLVSRRAQTTGRIALALYAAFLLGIAVWRPWTEPAPPFSGRWELVPFTGTADLWRAGIVPFVFLFVGNVACFVPFGFGLPALTPLRRAVVPICLLGSLLIEVLQWSFGTGVSQVEDILLNTLGAALGYALFISHTFPHFFPSPL